MATLLDEPVSTMAEESQSEPAIHLTNAKLSYIVCTPC